MCSSTTFKLEELPLLDFGVFYMSDGTNSREVQRTGGPTSINITPIYDCVSCPGPTPTPTPTSTPLPPTDTPTPTPTGVPPADTPTPTPTSTPTPTQVQSSYNVAWYHTVGTGTGFDLFQIWVNGNQQVYSTSTTTGNITVYPGDTVTYQLQGSSGDFVNCEINTYQGATLLEQLVGCAFQDESVNNIATGITFTENGEIDATSSRYIDGCP